MKKFNRFLCLALALVLMFSLCACGGKDKDKDDKNKEESSQVSQNPTATPAPTPEPEPQVEVVVVTGDGVYIRADASTDNSPIASADKGDTFQLLDKSNPDWFEIKYDGDKAYITSLYSEAKNITQTAYDKLFPEEPETDVNVDGETPEGDGETSEEESKVTAEDVRDAEDGEKQ